MWILGYHGPPIGWHDGSVCLVNGDGTVWAFAENERFTRTKHALNESPVAAVEHCLAVAGITRSDIDVVAVGWDLPILFTWLEAKWTFGAPSEFLAQNLGWTSTDRRPDVQFFGHHRTHAASAFYASGFEESAVLVVDGQGEDEATTLWTGRYGEGIVQRRRWPTAASLGFMYEGACRAIGLDFLEAGKTMGLASYGRGTTTAEPLMTWTGDDYAAPFEASPDATYKELQAAWAQAYGERFPDLPRTTPRDVLDKDEVSVRVAFSAQATIEDIVPRLAALARTSTGLDHLCLAGGVGLNCSVNGMLPAPVYVPPLAYDAGAALGAAWLVAPPKRPGPPLTPFLGYEIGAHEVADEAIAQGLVVAPLDTDEVARRLEQGQVGALAWGRAEIGARALGHRSIIALPDRRDVADHVNHLKSRELWRPLAPVGLARAEGTLWDPHPLLHRYMLGAVQVTDEARERIPATVHVDGTARAQIVDDADPGPLRAVIEAVESAGHPPVVMNTSFNDRGEPIVNTGTEALRTFGAIGLDFVVVGDLLVTPPG